MSNFHILNFPNFRNFTPIFYRNFWNFFSKLSKYTMHPLVLILVHFLAFCFLRVSRWVAGLENVLLALGVVKLMGRRRPQFGSENFEKNNPKINLKMGHKIEIFGPKMPKNGLKMYKMHQKCTSVHKHQKWPKMCSESIHWHFSYKNVTP